MSEPSTSRAIHDTEPVTDFESKTVMLRAERGDTVHIEGYGDLEVVQRQQTYHGPTLKLVGDCQGYELHAPGPFSQLRLIERVQDEAGFVTGLRPLGEVCASLVDEKQYDICACGEPVKTVEHHRMAYLGIENHG